MSDNGFFDLNFLFQKFYSLQANDDFFSQPYIQLESSGRRKKFWFTIDDGKSKQKYLYKECGSKNIYEAYGEIIAKEIANILDIPCADYILAKFDYDTDNLHIFKDSYGVITPNFLKENERLVHFGEIISTVYNQVIKDSDDMQELYNVKGLEDWNSICHFNNLEDIWSILDFYFKAYPNKQQIVQQIMQSLVQLYLFDVITIQGDRNIHNFGIIINRDTNEIRFAPIYDNSNIFNLNRPKITSFLNLSRGSKYILNDKKFALQKEISHNMLYHSKLLFSANTEDFLSSSDSYKKAKHMDSLELFLKKSDRKTVELLEKYVSQLEEFGPENIIKVCKHKNAGHQFPIDFIEYFSTSFQMNLNNIKNLIQKEQSNYRR